jgi:hypothetical protein
MFSHASLIKLNFNESIISRRFVDKKTGLLITLGLSNGLSFPYENFEKLNQGFTIALQEQGFGQGELDRSCDRLAGHVADYSLNVLVVKSDLPFDNRWFIMGDLRSLFDLADRDKIKLPFGFFMFGSIMIEFEEYED